MLTVNTHVSATNFKDWIVLQIAAEQEHFKIIKRLQIAEV